MKKALLLILVSLQTAVAFAQWTVENLSVGRYQHAGASSGNIAMVGGGLINNNATMSSLSAVVDVYNNTTGTWSTAQLSQPRTDLSAASAGNKILFAGGRPDYAFPYNFSRQVDIYDVTANTWSVAQLSAPRFQMTAVSAGNKCFFAGGVYFSGFNSVSSDTIDIYDAVTNTWSIEHLPAPRHLLASAYANGKVYFASGQSNAQSGIGTIYAMMDIYDIATSSWSSISFPHPRKYLTGGSLGNLIFFAGGDVTQANPDYIDIYNTVTGQWTSKTMAIGKQFIEVTALGSKIYFSGGSDAGFIPKNTMDIYDITTNTWTTHNLSVARSRHASVSVGNRIMFAGGSFLVQGGLPQISVDVFTDATVGIDDHTDGSVDFSVFPNPASDHMTIELRNVTKDARVFITDMAGRMVYATSTSNTIEINTHDFSEGIYFVKIQSKEFTGVKKLIIDRN